MPPQVLQQDVAPQARVDVDSPHVATVPSDYSGETDTQYERIEREAEAAERATQQRFEEVESKTTREFRNVKKSVKRTAREAEDKAEEAAASLKQNRDNPVVVGNFAVWAGVAALLGYVFSRAMQVRGSWLIHIFAALAPIGNTKLAL